MTHPDVERPFRVPLHPLPEIIVILGFGFVFLTTQNWIFHGEFPLLEAGVLVFLVGALVFFVAFPNGRRATALDGADATAADATDEKLDPVATGNDMKGAEAKEESKEVEAVEVGEVQLVPARLAEA